MEKENPKTHRKTCTNCGADIDFNREDVLTQLDVTAQFPDIYIKSIRCPYCWKKNILEWKDTNGNIHKYDYGKI